MSEDAWWILFVYLNIGIFFAVAMACIGPVEEKRKGNEWGLWENVAVVSFIPLWPMYLFLNWREKNG